MGAVGLLVHRLARAAGGTVVGRPVPAPFADTPFQPARPGWGLGATARYARGAATAIGPQPLLVEVHNRPEVALILARRFRRVALVLHNDPQGMRGARTAGQRAALVRRLAGVAVVSAHLARRFGDGAEVFPNSLDIPRAAPAERERLILFVGRVVADKGADAFVAACAAVLPALPGWRAEMVGADRFAADSPATAFTDRVRAAAAAAGVAMRGYLGHEAAMERMSRAAIAVVPSRWDEPFGLTALEAMAHGAALVCAPRGGLPEVAGECAVYADPDVPGELAAAVLALAQDAPRRAALATAARERALGFDTTVAAGRLRALRERWAA